MPKRKTQEETIEDFKKAHGNLYGYENMAYVNVDTKIDILCYEHGIFQQSPAVHKKGHGCPECSFEENKHSEEKCIEDFIEVWGDRFDLSKVKYVNSMTKVEIICEEHGSFFIRPRDFKKGRGCRNCFYDSIKSNTEDFIKKSNKVFGFKYLYDKTKYTLVVNKICVTCPEHGDFLVVAANHLKGCGCKICHNIENGDRQRTPVKEVLKNFRDMHGDRYTYPNLKELYKNATIPIPIICDIHGEFFQSAHTHGRGSNCPDCCLENKGWTYSKWIKAASESNNFESFKLYIIRFTSGLYKIGRTFVTLKNRLRHIPLDYQVIQVVTLEDGRKICELETLFKNLCAGYTQLPSISFKGENECFSSIDPIKELLKEY